MSPPVPGKGGLRKRKYPCMLVIPAPLLILKPLQRNPPSRSHRCRTHPRRSLKRCLLKAPLQRVFLLQYFLFHFLIIFLDSINRPKGNPARDLKATEFPEERKKPKAGISKRLSVIDDEAEEADDDEEDEGSEEFPESDLLEDDIEEDPGHATMIEDSPKEVPSEAKPPKVTEQGSSKSRRRRSTVKSVELTDSELSHHGVASLFASLRCYKDMDFSCEHPLLKLAQETNVSHDHGSMILNH